MVIRVKFDAEVYIEGDDMQDVKRKWENLPLFSEEAEKCGADFCEVVSVEDDDTYDDVTDEFYDA